MSDCSVGIDIGKYKFDVAVLSPQGASKYKNFPNTSDGFKELIKWLGSAVKLAPHFCMEATGRYGEQLAFFLHDAGYSVSVVNPVCIKNYGKSKLRRTKNDKVDSMLIAIYCQNESPKLWQPLPKASRELQALTREMYRAKDLLAQEKTRLKAGQHCRAVLSSIESRLFFLEAQVEELETLINAHIDSCPQLKKQKRLLVTIPGVAETTANALLGEIPDVHRFAGVRQLVAYAGLAPSERSSGTLRGQTRLSKVGSSRLRKILYMPAVCGKRYNPAIIAFCNRIEAGGKSKMVALGGAMRKLLHIVYGILKSETPFDARIHLQKA
ncbi:MAG TPA: IS110 family transposase [Candidatus Obscuribacterales bacterium]